MSQPEAAPRLLRGSRSVLSELAQVVVLALILYFVITFAVQTVRVVGLSMYPSLNTEDYLIATKVDYRLHGPGRGDIVILKSPYSDQTDFIKRVIALPGEKLLISKSRVYIDGRLLDEPYLGETWVVNGDWPRPGASGASNAAVTIPPGKYFVMGDNRNHSSDSRAFGPIARDQIDSRAWVRILPIQHLGPVDRDKPALASGPAAAAR